MPQHLKVKAEVVSKEIIRLTILGQTHFGANFGNEFTGVFISKSKNKIMVAATGLESRLQSAGRTGTYACFNMRDRAKGVFDIPADTWKELKAEIEAYNEWGAKQP